MAALTVLASATGVPGARSGRAGVLARVPFAERGGSIRGVLDLVTGCYPRFLFGGGLGGLLPVFHFHDVTHEWLRPRIEHLVDNGYRTVTCDEIAALVVHGRSPGPRAVALTFDDAWASVWSVAMPLVQQHTLRAIVFAIPARVGDPAGRFVTWDQLVTMHESGIFDVQSHTRSHAMVFGGDAVVDFVTPAFGREPLLNRPVISSGECANQTFADGTLRVVEPQALGTPLQLRRSRMSDALRFYPDEAAAARCRDHVARHGGAAFFERPAWRRELARLAAGTGGRFETGHARVTAIREELTEGRAELNARLRTTSVRHVALPWGVAGTVTRQALKETGHELAFAERPMLQRGVRSGDDPHQLMRLNGKFITCLPGKGRQWFLTAARRG